MFDTMLRLLADVAALCHQVFLVCVCERESECECQRERARARDVAGLPERESEKFLLTIKK